jgi:hypothetical protein
MKRTQQSVNTSKDKTRRARRQVGHRECLSKSRAAESGLEPLRQFLQLKLRFGSQV